MPRGKKSPNGKVSLPANDVRKYFRPSDAPWGGYINLRVSAGERADFDGWSQAEGEAIYAYLDDCLTEGLKYGHSYDAENSCYIATLTGGGCLMDPARYVLLARGATWWESLALLMYKHEVLLHGDWSNYRPATGRHTFG